MIEGKYIAVGLVWLSCGIAAWKDGGAAISMSFFAVLATLVIIGVN